MTKMTPQETNKKKSFILYYDLHDSVSEMTDMEAGILFKSILHFHATKEKPEVPESLRFLFIHLLSQFKRDGIKYSKICAKRSAAGTLGAKQKLAKAGKCKQMKQKLANQADNDTDNDTDNENDINKTSSWEEVKEVWKHYNVVREKMPECKKLTATRQSRIRSKIKEVGLEELKRVISSCIDMPHLQGANDRGWTADLEWIVNDNNFTKIIEGRYIKKTPSSRFEPMKEMTDEDCTI